MAKRFIQTSLNAGEMAETMSGRVDFQKYFNGLSSMINFIPLKQGGAEKRPGLEYVVEAKGVARLIPFEFSVEDTVVIETGDEYMRFLTEDGQVEIDDPIPNEDFVELGKHRWIESSSGFDEWYMARPNGLIRTMVKPDRVYEQSVLMIEGTAGSLERGEWAFSNNDNLGKPALYVRLTLRA